MLGPHPEPWLRARSFRTDRKAIEVAVELSMCDRTLGLLVESDSERAAKADRRHDNVVGADSFPDRAIATGNPTRSYRTRHPMRVISEVHDWEGHAPDVRQSMLDSLAELREQGLDLIED